MRHTPPCASAAIGTTVSSKPHAIRMVLIRYFSFNILDSIDIAAANDLGITVVMIRRPVLADIECVHTVEDAVWACREKMGERVRNESK